MATGSGCAAGWTEGGFSDFVSESLTMEDPPGGFAGERGGPPWAQPERYRRLSPLTYVERIRTPLLLIHSELDQNCPINQSEQLYTAPQLLGRDAEFLRIPCEGHLVNLVGRPSSRLARIR